MAPFTAAAGTGGSHTNTAKDFLYSTKIKPLSSPEETRKSPENYPTPDIVASMGLHPRDAAIPLIHSTINTTQVDVSTVKLGTTVPIAVPTASEPITPGADNSLRTTEVGATTLKIINYNTVDYNFDGDTSATGDGLIPPSPSSLAFTAIVDQDSETSIVNPTSAFLPQIITIGDLPHAVEFSSKSQYFVGDITLTPSLPHTVEFNSESQYLVGDITLAPSLLAITISSSPISLGPYQTSQIIIGSTTVPRRMPLTSLRYYQLTSLVDSVTSGYPLPGVPAASAILGHLPNRSSPNFTSNPAGYTGTNRSSTGIGTYVRGVAVLPTGRAPISSTEPTPHPSLANAAARMEFGARGLFAAAFGLRVCLWWV